MLSNSYTRSFYSVLLSMVFILFATPAWSHHPMGGEIPFNFLSGFLSGLGHPIIGLDHLTFVVTIGFITATLGYRYRLLLPGVFILATALGTFIHLLELPLLLSEVVIAISVLGGGSVLLFSKSLSLQRWGGLFGFAGVGGLFGFAGVFHGYAYGESIVGAETTPLLAYLIGFMLIQGSIALGTAFLLGRQLKNRAFMIEKAGGVFAGIGLVFVYQTIPLF